MNTIFFAWTVERIDRIKELWMAGLSAAQCAADLGISRNSAMGKICRLNLPKRKTVSSIESRDVLPKPKRKHRRKESPPLQPQAATSFRVRSNGKGAVLREDVPDMELVDLPDEDIPVEQRKTLLELEWHSCRWPCGDPGTPSFYFCGAESHGLHSYCYAHFRRATVAPSKLRVPYIPARTARL